MYMGMKQREAIINIHPCYVVMMLNCVMSSNSCIWGWSNVRLSSTFSNVSSSFSYPVMRGIIENHGIQLLRPHVFAFDTFHEVRKLKEFSHVFGQTRGLITQVGLGLIIENYICKQPHTFKFIDYILYIIDHRL